MAPGTVSSTSVPAPTSAPKLQTGPDSLCQFVLPRYAPMSGTSTRSQNLGVDPLAIVTDTQSKLILIVTDFKLRCGSNAFLKCGISHACRNLPLPSRHKTC